MQNTTKVWKKQLTPAKHNQGLPNNSQVSKKTTKVWKTQPIPEKHNHGLINTTQVCKTRLRSEKHK